MRDAIECLAFLVIVFAWGFGLVLGFSILSANQQKSQLEELGYEAKVVSLSCFAKSNGRWVSCSAVVNNQVEVVK